MTFTPPDPVAVAADARARLDQVNRDAAAAAETAHRSSHAPLTLLPALLFVFEGRLARLPYFGCNLLVVVGAGLFALFGVNFAEDGAGFAGIPLILAAVVVGLWGGLAINIERLHDIGMNGAHAWWIYAVILAHSGLSRGSQLEGAMWVVHFGVGLWLTLMPGQPEDNEYGRVPDTGGGERSP